jgi:NADH:ubiquinone oxidoreductase subunit E
VSFYTTFYTRPVGKFVAGVPHAVVRANAPSVTESCRVAGITPGETDASGTFTLVEVECLGVRPRAPW